MKNNPSPSLSPAIVLHGSIWMTSNGENLGGRGRIALLAKVIECGSITQAAKAFGMSYKAAWDAIDTMNNIAGEALVVRTVGGKGGGKTTLTARGKKLIDNFCTIEKEHQRFITQLSEQAGNLADDYLLIRRMGMKTSARNQFQGKIVALQSGAVNDQITLEIAGGEKIIATITRESTEYLGITVGSEAFALIKASSIILAVPEQGIKGIQGMRLSASNQLTGVVQRVKAGAVNTEVVLDLSGGNTLIAIVTHASGEAMGLIEGAQGMPLVAIFQASSVIVGLAA